MCVAGLNVSLQPCHKLRLEGWETRQDICPWCSAEEAAAVDDATHRLFGTSSASLPSNSMPLGSTRSARSASSSSSTRPILSRSSSSGSEQSDAGQRNREMNLRVNAYLLSSPKKRVHWSDTSSDCEDEASQSTSDDGSVRGIRIDRRVGMFGRGWRKSIKLGKGMFRG
ncbi:hypothetical protein LTR28_003808 [Elasticomyces elasticus]|nr:hypothetical protein LTR28_003808 [Elasticomyces elasticus]